MIVSMIAAMGSNRVIGKGNQMMWRLPLEFSYFKNVTMGHALITGRKNIQAQGRPLPGRTNIVVTRQKDFLIEGCVVVHSIEEGIAYAKSIGETEVFITGGGEIYKQSLSFTDRIYLTHVDYSDEGEVYFPEFDESLYDISIKAQEEVSEKNTLSWKAFLYVKKV
jgi:dihydrofolate reductase